MHCLKYALSKGLGLGIVIGGGIVKIPQVSLLERVTCPEAFADGKDSQDREVAIRSRSLAFSICRRPSCTVSKISDL